MLDAGSVVSSPAVEAFMTDAVDPPLTSGAFIAISPAMKHVVDLMKRAAATNRPVVIVGEASTGKEFIARQIHLGRDRMGERFIAVDASADWQNVQARIGSGSRRGALFVAEMATMPLPLQLKVLRSCSGRGADLRLIATVSHDRRRQRKDDSDVGDRFRHELYRQREAIIIDVPPLRDRRGDIALLARHFLAQVRAEMTMSAEAERELEAYHWPDNLVELQSVVTQAALTTEGTEVTVDALRHLLRRTTDVLELAAMPYHEMLEKARARVSREYFTVLLRETRGNVTVAAQRAGLARESLHRMLKSLGLSAQDFRLRS